MQTGLLVHQDEETDRIQCLTGNGRFQSDVLVLSGSGKAGCQYGCRYKTGHSAFPRVLKGTLGAGDVAQTGCSGAASLLGMGSHVQWGVQAVPADQTFMAVKPL